MGMQVVLFRTRILRVFLMRTVSWTGSLVESDEIINEEHARRYYIFGICTMVEIGEESLDIMRPR